MKIRMILFVFGIATAPISAYAQSTAQPVVPGSLSTSGCPGGGTPCFSQYSSSNPLPVTSSGSGTGNVDITQVGGNAVTTTIPVSGTTTANQGTANAGGAAAWPVQGGVASGSADSGNPVKVGGKYNATAPTFTDGQRGDTQIDQRGNAKTSLYAAGNVTAVGTATGAVDAVSAAQTGLFMVPYNEIFNGSAWDREFTCANSAVVNVTAGNTTQIVALSGTTVIRVCSIIGSMSLAGTMTVSYGTGTNCGTGNTALTGTMALATGTPVNLSNGMGSVVRSAAGNAICIAAATGNFTGVLTYAQY